MEETTWIEALGTLLVEPGDVRIYVGKDFCKYYRWLFTAETYKTIRVNTTAHDGHITIINAKVYPDTDTSMLMRLNGAIVPFRYDPYGRAGGRSKGFLNFYFFVDCPFIQYIKNLAGVVDGDNYYGDHITLFNNKQYTKLWQQPKNQ